MFASPNYEADAYPHMNEIANINHVNQPMQMEMEEEGEEGEIQDLPVIEKYQRETSLIEQLNENLNHNRMTITSPSMKENMRPINRLDTNLGFSRQHDSPTSCLIKSRNQPFISLYPNIPS